MKRTDHVRIENTESGAYRMFCTHCGASFVIRPPAALDMAVAMMKQFQKGRRQCKPKAAAPAVPATVEDIR